MLLTSRISEHAHESLWLPFPSLPGTHAFKALLPSDRTMSVLRAMTEGHQGLISLYLLLIIIFLCGSALPWDPSTLLMGLCGLNASMHVHTAPPASEFHPDNWFLSVLWHLPSWHRMLLGPLFHFWVTKPLQASQAKAIVASLTFLIN